MLSANGTYSLHLQNDGDLVLYGNYDGEANQVWSSGSGSSVMSYQMETTDDGGNLVILDSDGNIIWSTGNDENFSYQPYAEVSDNGNLNLYDHAGITWRARKYKSRRHSNKK